MLSLLAIGGTLIAVLMLSTRLFFKIRGARLAGKG